MRKPITIATGLLLFAIVAQVGRAVEMTWEFSVQVSASVQVAPNRITLTWPQDQYMLPTSYTVYRKAPGDSGWGNGVNLPGTATSYVDNSVVVGIPYEYQIVKVTSQYTGYGYLYSGINVPMIDNRGKLLLVVDNTYANALTNELARLQRDLTGDGWTPLRIDVGRNDSVQSVKDKIKAQYAADPADVKCVFLFGHVPVPYSGDIVPDGHTPNHQGAWPCDGFYGDMDGTWTDNSVNDTGADYPRNQNVPGDGKFDQSTFPAPIKLMVGRVDLANLPGELWYGGPTTIPGELALLRNYLNKDHRYRTKQFSLPQRGMVGDFIGVRNGEAFAASGYRNFSTFFGANNITKVETEGTWTQLLKTTPYLWGYGCGSGSLASVAGLGNSDSYHNVTTSELYTNDIKAAFVLFFGSWLGDWDGKDDIMRCVLALPSCGLASAWSGRPHWFLQHMGLGETIGYSTRLTQNNGPNGLYQNKLNTAAGQIHVALMGDPTLRLHIVAPATQMSATATGGSVKLSWNASADPVVGYHVYRMNVADGSFARLTSSPVNDTNYTDATGVSGASYMVRAVSLETSSSGSYFNPSTGTFVVAGSGTTTQTNAGSVQASLQISSNVPTLTWVSNPNKQYKVSYKDNLTDPAWVAITQVTATQSTTSWVDPSAPPGRQRFYQVTQTN
jgi:hypothetical protein